MLVFQLELPNNKEVRPERQREQWDKMIKDTRRNLLTEEPEGALC
jgi:hypothetical protein